MDSGVPGYALCDTLSLLRAFLHSTLSRGATQSEPLGLLDGVDAHAAHASASSPGSGSAGNTPAAFAWAEVSLGGLIAPLTLEVVGRQRRSSARAFSTASALFRAAGWPGRTRSGQATRTSTWFVISRRSVRRQRSGLMLSSQRADDSHLGAPSKIRCSACWTAASKALFMGASTEA